MNDILRNFPHSFDSERLTIRCPLPGDGPEVNAAVVESWDELRPWMVWAKTLPTVDETEANLREAHARFLTRQSLRLLLFLKGTHTLVGSSGLHSIDWSVPCFEIGYWLRTSFTGQGYATEAARAIANFAFDVLGAKRVGIRCDALNERSAAVARRLGFEHEGTLHCSNRHHLTGELRDEMIFAKVKTP
ncbi:MAG: GNAT family N-acetyltransferase [Chloroflexota bacterium]